MGKITPTDMLAFLRAKTESRQQKLDVSFQKAQADAARIVQMIIERFNPKKIYQWGSLLNRRHFSENSDIDIGIEGLEIAESFFEIIAEAEKLSEFPVDIVEVDKILPEFAEQIRTRGKVLYEREN